MLLLSHQSLATFAVCFGIYTTEGWTFTPYQKQVEVRSRRWNNLANQQDFRASKTLVDKVDGRSNNHPRTGNTEFAMPVRRIMQQTTSTQLGATRPHSSVDQAEMSSKTKLVGVFASSLILVITLAKMNMIGPYTDQLILQDTFMSILSSILALTFVKAITALSAKGVLQPRDSRKIIHSFAAPLFMIVWPFFSDVTGARFFAASIPLLQAVRLWMAAMDKGGEEGNELAAAISRSGDSKEALGGPFIYVVILFAAIITCFKDSFAGMMALSAMAAGDGMADIFGRRFGKSNKWFINPDKSMAGTLAFIIASSLCSIGIGFYFQFMGTIPLTIPFVELAKKLVTISVLSAFIELVPFGDDNWSVPIGAAVLSFLLLQ